MVKDLYPIVVAKRREIFEDSVTVAALRQYLEGDQSARLFAATTIIYRLEAEGYVSKPLAELEYKRKLLK